MKKLINVLLLTSFLFGAAAVKAQKSDTVKTKGWFKHDIAGAAQIQLTYRKSNNGQLNSILNNSGIPSIANNDLWINASMSHICHSLIMEDGIGFTPIASSEVNNLKASYNQYQAYLRAGYNLSSNTDFRLYPFVGVNFSAAVLTIQDKNREQNVTSFSSELLNSTSSKTFYQPNFGIELGAGFDYVIKLKPKKMDCFEVARNIPIGVRAGYYFNTYQSDWRINSYSLQNGPKEKQSAVFLSFNIGLGYGIKKKG